MPFQPLLLLVAAALTARGEDLLIDPRIPCLIEPAETIELMSPIDGVIGRFEVERGDAVQRGDIVAVLEDSVEQEELSVARSELSRAETDVKLRAASARLARRSADRVAGLHAKASATDQELEQAETEAVIAELELERARAAVDVARSNAARAAAVLERRVLRSPVDGVITARMLSPGESVDQRSIAIIQAVDVLHVETLLPLHMFRTVHAGELTRIRIGPPVEAMLEGRVAIVDPVVDPASETFGVRVMVRPGNSGAAPGLGCRAIDFEAAGERITAAATDPSMSLTRFSSEELSP